MRLGVPYAAAAMAALSACSDRGGDGAAQTGAANAVDVMEEPAPGPASPAERHARPDGQQWFTKTHREGPWAGFGPPFSEAAFSARCEGARLVFNTTEMPPSGPGATQMRLSFGGRTQTLPATASEEGLPSTDAAVPADAAWLNDLASASGELMVIVGESDPLSVPISEPLTSLIRDCAQAASS